MAMSARWREEMIARWEKCAARFGEDEEVGRFVRRELAWHRRKLIEDREEEEREARAAARLNSRLTPSRLAKLLSLLADDEQVPEDVRERALSDARRILCDIHLPGEMEDEALDDELERWNAAGLL